MPLEKGQRQSGPSWWLSILACIVSFSLGRIVDTSTSLSAFNSPTKAKDCPSCPTCNTKTEEISVAAVKPIECPKCPESNCKDCDAKIPDGVVFDDSWVADPKSVLETFNKMCRVIIDHGSKPEGRKLGIGTIMFCYTHVLTFKRNYDYAWDNVESIEMGYYTGTMLPPYQMDMFQYAAILSTMASIPSKPIKTALEEKGKEFQDKANNYNVWKKTEDLPRGEDGPRVLFWGCGSDTPLHVNLVEFLGGSITFIDNNEEWAKECRKTHPDIRLIEPVGKKDEHTQLIAKLVSMDGAGLDTDDVNDPLTESQWMSNIAGVENDPPWDIIVVDGPAEALGRSQPLYMAKRLAQSYGPNHYTHIFLHDASRHDNCVIANAIMGHGPSEYMGNTLPRKGLKHWRVSGRNRKLPPTKTI